MECKHGLDTRWCAVCIHGPSPPRPSRQPRPVTRGLPRPGETPGTSHGLADLGGDGPGRIRFVCACGAVGAWALDRAQARRMHREHSRGAQAPTGAGSAPG